VRVVVDDSRGRAAGKPGRGKLRLPRCADCGPNVEGQQRRWVRQPTCAPADVEFIYSMMRQLLISNSLKQKKSPPELTPPVPPPGFSVERRPRDRLPINQGSCGTAGLSLPGGYCLASALDGQANCSL
jgi:hypothetical protein